MLILTEKPSVAKDFASALGFRFSGGTYQSGTDEITNCIGHLFALEEPSHYGNGFPIIPPQFDYRINPPLEKQARLVISRLKAHRSDSILIATDADREGEIIARECLAAAGITDFSRIKRFWVSQALTKEVIQDGIRSARPLHDYDILSEQGFARQKSDWLVGMNFCRYITRQAGTRLVVGRVQTAVLSAIEQRCNAIRNFKSEKYFEHYGAFRPAHGGTEIHGIYFENGETGFNDNSRHEKLTDCIGKQARLKDSRTERKTENPPQLYNLNAAQKDAFRHFGYPADKTLKIIQSLYEELKCVSYPRTPSRVMGSGNVELCRKIFSSLIGSGQLEPSFSDRLKKVLSASDISLKNKRVFNDSKLEAHHAIIPLKALPENAGEEQKDIYWMIYNRFTLAFLPPCEYEKQTCILQAGGYSVKITGKRITNSGYKDFETCWDENEETEKPEQSLENIDWSTLVLSSVETKEKWTKPPAHFNEASILSFMENPRQEDRHVSVQDEPRRKLAGLGTAATRHTFIPKLIKYGYIALEKKNIVCTPLGASLLNAVRGSAIKSLADISETTSWEERLDENPGKFLSDIKTFVRESVSKEDRIEIPAAATATAVCPACGKEVRRGKANWYCSGYKEGCKFVLWETVAGAKLTEKDVIKLCGGGKTGTKHCTNKAGRQFDCKFLLDENRQIKFEF